ncbi:U32 family peptidase [Carboxylicivirga sp. M1479]|uniref:peptidase U32 family protein n=2 Tax=Carboxylicivirga TaxID=1628153 RepID=UPI00163DB2E7|nr:U32 family peptidase [Carboxylicivirga sp. M1479]
MDSDKNRTIELLSPAKNIECGLAAINHGADAVYIGGPGFGARKSAGNSIEDIKALISYAHLYGVKIYVTINTLLFDQEINAANELIHQLHKIGADAVIIQDMGLLETELPPIPIHASTQTDNRSIEKVQFLEDVGFDQVVLARELSTSEIKSIKQATSVPLEYFIHGALCVCYSGQCYMSASINKRSANRGECAQPCRLKYSLKNKKGQVLYKDKHLLSLHDLNLSEHIEQLIDAGVSSFKIEGRLKDKDYVANITAHYRQLLDTYIQKKSKLKKASSGFVASSFEPQADKSFNRGFTNYFVNGREKGIWSIDTPKALGEKIGKIKQIGKNSFTLDSAISMNNGDGICFFTKKKELTGLKINQVEGNNIFPNQITGLKEGMTLYRNFNRIFNQQVNNNTSKRKINVDIVFEELNDNTFSLSMLDDDQIKSTIEAQTLTPDIANNPERALSQIQTQLAKLGNTAFAPANVHINLKQNWFFQAKELNALRRQLIDKHEVARREYFKAKERAFSKSEVPFPQEELNYTANIINSKAQAFYKRHGVNNSTWGFEKIEHIKGAELMRTKHCLLYMNDQCLKEHPEARQQLPLTLYNNKDSYELSFDCKNCEMIVKKAPK